eukprot:PhF_6_TR22254/c0_g1_i1/m.31441
MLGELFSRPLLVVHIVALSLLTIFLPFIMIPIIILVAIGGYLRHKHVPRILPTVQSPRAHPKTTDEIMMTSCGLKIKYHVIPSARGKSAPWFVFVNPLGQRGISIFFPIIAVYGDKYNYVCWDYRGLFESDAPEQRRRISIFHHAEDLNSLLNHLSITDVFCMVGHSMGVQVALEYNALYPDVTKHLVLLNGTHGQVFQSGMQPVFRVPFVGDMCRWLVATLIHHSTTMNAMRICIHPIISLWMTAYASVFGSKMLQELEGPDYLVRFLENYIGNLVSEKRTCVTFLRLFQELDAHSIYHVLPDIKTRTLVISGLWDVLTPMYCSLEIARQMPNARHYCDVFSSHASILENPERVIMELTKFLE